MDIKALAKAAREAARHLAAASSETKTGTLRLMADLLEESTEEIVGANRRDLDKAKESGLSGAMLDRLTLTEHAIQTMAEGIREVAALRDPVGEVVKMWRRPNGLLVGRMRIPLGVVGMIYEARPNVTSDAAALCLKSGNAVILRGGSEAFYSNQCIADVLQRSLERGGLPRAAVTMIPTAERSAVREMLRLDELIDVIIPRGGEELIRTVVEESRVPVIKHYKGVCHTFLDRSADPEMAVAICLNAKVQRPGVCNAMETLLVHEELTTSILPALLEHLRKAGVEIRGCPKTQEAAPWVKPAHEDDWGNEFLDLVLAVRVIRDIDEAIDHISRYGSDHTEAIITENYANAQTFLQKVQSSVVLVNASTRFSDGNQLGLGAEIGISTTKLHAYGPMGIEELTTTKFVVYGDGQIRQ